MLGDGKIDWLKLGLTYAIPYCVATYGAATVRIAISRRDAPPS